MKNSKCIVCALKKHCLAKKSTKLMNSKVTIQHLLEWDEVQNSWWRSIVMIEFKSLKRVAKFSRAIRAHLQLCD
jgi:hypothetical protein